MKNLVFIFLVALFVGCEPGYRVYIHNNTSNALLLKTHPSIESLYPNRRNGYYDSILINKISEDKNLSLYRIKPFNAFRIWDNVGTRPTSNTIPYDYVEIISGTDTLILDSKEKIISELKKGNKKYDYYVEVVK